jgi:hypothetical protein
MNSRTNEESKRNPTDCAQDIPTREEWLHRVLFSGEVDKVAQHLALAIDFESGETGVLRASARDLERLTGWSRATIAEHLRTLEKVSDIIYGTGRAKSQFRLPYVEPEEVIEVVTVESKAAIRTATIAEFGHVCSHCETQGDAIAGPDGRPWCLDRIIPGVVGGKYQPNNVTLSCWACNSKRGASPIERRTFSLADWRAMHCEWVDVGAFIDVMGA